MVRRMVRVARYLAQSDGFERRLWAATRLESAKWGVLRALSRDSERAAELGRRQAWARGALAEVSWWKAWLSSPESAEWKARVADPSSAVEDPLLAEVAGSMAEDEVTILDVGAGPASRIGWVLPGKAMQVTAVDPLARHYRRLLARLGIAPVVPVVPGSGEGLLSQFVPGTFDIVYACNALDHSRDPMVVIRNMFSLARPGGAVVFRHYANEAEVGGYDGLHQWNFENRDGSLVVWNRTASMNLTDQLPSRTSITLGTEPAAAFGGHEWSDWVTCVVRKSGRRAVKRGSPS